MVYDRTNNSFKSRSVYINPNLLFKKLKEYNEYKEYVEALNSTSVFSDGESKPEVQGIQYSKDSNSKK